MRAIPQRNDGRIAITSTGAPRIRLSSHLLRLAAATMLPLIVLAVVGALLLARNEREVFERGARDRVRALSSAVDAELRGTETSLQALAQVPSLREGDLAAFHATAVQVKLVQPHWLTVSLALPGSGRQLINVLQPYGTKLPVVPERTTFDKVVATRLPAVTDMFQGPLTKRANFAIRVPVIVDSEVRYVLSAGVDPAMVQVLLQQQRFPSGWVGVVVDRNLRVVARSANPGETVGKPASAALRVAIARASEASFQGQTLEGTEVYTSFFTSPATGWSVAMGVPAALVEATGNAAMRTVAMIAGLALLGGFAVAVFLGRRISGPIAALARRADALAAGTPLPDEPLDAPVIEVERLGAALDHAATAVRERAAAQRELTAVTENATLALFLMDEQQRSTYMNPAAEALTGYTLAEARGRSVHDIVHASRPDGSPYPVEACPLIRAFTLNERQQGEDVFTTKAGRFIPVAFTASPIRRDGRAVGRSSKPATSASTSAPRRSGGSCWRARRRHGPRPRPPTAPRTSSSPCSATSSAIR